MSNVERTFQDRLASLEAEQRLIQEQLALTQRLASLETQKRRLIEEHTMRFDRPANGVRSGVGVGLDDAVGSEIGGIHAPLIAGTSQHDWIIKTLEANRDGVKDGPLVKFLAMKIETKAKDPEKAVRDALSLLYRQRKIQKFNGSWRI